MSTYDKSSQHGYDDLDKEVQEAMEEFEKRDRKAARKLRNRVHDALLIRLKEQAAIKCHSILQDFEECTKHRLATLHECFPIRDSLNECYKSVHTEENYQKLRVQFLHGELLQMSQERMVAKVESFKSQAPLGLTSWKLDYADRYKDANESLGIQPEIPLERAPDLPPEMLEEGYGDFARERGHLPPVPEFRQSTPATEAAPASRHWWKNYFSSNNNSSSSSA